jgi:hypothetical protein
MDFSFSPEQMEVQAKARRLAQEEGSNEIMHLIIAREVLK